MQKKFKKKPVKKSFDEKYKNLDKFLKDIKKGIKGYKLEEKSNKVILYDKKGDEVYSGWDGYTKREDQIKTIRDFIKNIDELGKEEALGKLAYQEWHHKIIGTKGYNTLERYRDEIYNDKRLKGAINQKRRSLLGSDIG